MGLRTLFLLIVINTNTDFFFTTAKNEDGLYLPKLRSTILLRSSADFSTNTVTSNDVTTLPSKTLVDPVEDNQLFPDDIRVTNEAELFAAVSGSQIRPVTVRFLSSIDWTGDVAFLRIIPPTLIDIPPTLQHELCCLSSQQFSS